MKKSMPDYITALSKDNFEILEEIICKKYRKFRDLYKMINKYHDNISSLTYKETKDDELKVNLVISKLKVEKVISELKESIPKGGNVTIKKVSKEIQIMIKKEEIDGKVS